MGNSSNYYTFGSVARKVHYDVYAENKVLKNLKIRKSFRKIKFKIVLTVLFLFACSMVTIFRYAEITDLNYRIDKSKKTYDKIYNDNLKLKVSIEKSLDLSHVRDIATTRLGMHKPERYQVVPVSVPKSDFVNYSEKALKMIQEGKGRDKILSAGLETDWITD